MEVCMVHLNHPCREIDIWVAQSDSEVAIGKGQGYVTLDELRQMQALIAELENLLSTEREYSVEVVQRNNRFAERIAELEATLADERDTNARLQETINRNTVTFDQTKGILDALMRVLGNAI